MCKFFMIYISILSVYAAQDNDVIATVNSTPITRKEFKVRYGQTKLFLSNAPLSKQKVLKQMADKIIGVQRAKATGVDKDPEVMSKIEDVLFHAMVSKDLTPKMKTIKVEKKDIDSYYANNPEVRTAHILLRLRATPSEEEVKAAMNKALELSEKLKKNPAKFPELANKYTQSTAAPNGGDIGFRPKVALSPEYYEAIKNKKAGHITTPVRTQLGLHIIKVIAIKKRQDIDEKLYKKIVYDEKRDELMRKYFKSLRDKSKIEIKDAKALKD